MRSSDWSSDVCCSDLRPIQYCAHSRFIKLLSISACPVQMACLFPSQGCPIRGRTNPVYQNHKQARIDGNGPAQHQWTFRAKIVRISQTTSTMLYVLAPDIGVFGM